MGKRFYMLVSILLAILIIGLSGCSGSQASSKIEDMKAQYVGSWQLYEADYEGTEDDLSHDMVVSLRELDESLDSTLDFDDANQVIFDAFGASLSGTWKIVDENTISIVIEDDQAHNCVLKDGLLVLENEGEFMMFEKVSATPNMSDHTTVDLDQILGLSEDLQSDVDAHDLVSEESDSVAELYIDDVSEIRSLDVIVTDEEDYVIKAYAIGSDWEGDPGVLLSIENKSGEDLLIVGGDNFTVNGESAKGSLFRHVKAGTTAKAYLFFSASETGGAERFETIKGTINVFNTDYEYIDTYELDIK